MHLEWHDHGWLVAWHLIRLLSANSSCFPSDTSQSTVTDFGIEQFFLYNYSIYFNAEKWCKITAGTQKPAPVWLTLMQKRQKNVLTLGQDIPELSYCHISKTTLMAQKATTDNDGQLLCCSFYIGMYINCHLSKNKSGSTCYTIALVYNSSRQSIMIMLN